MLRIGILVAGVLLLVAIFLFGRPKKPSQGRRIETTERDTARVEPSLSGDDTSEQVQDYSDERISQPELGLAGGTPVAGVESDLGKRMKPLRVDGGAAANDLLMQIQADVLGRRLIRPNVIETTVAGACYLAGLGVGLWNNTAAVKKMWRAEREFTVQMRPAARRQRLASWNEALQRTLL